MNLAATSQSLKLLNRFFDAKTSTQPAIDGVCDKDVFPIEVVEKPLEMVTPESEGISSSYILSFIREVVSNPDINIQNIIVIRHGKIICEVSVGSQNINVQKYTFSACKSIISLGIGMLIDRGLLSEDEKLSDIFDKECPTRSKIRSKQITVRHLLTMQSGLAFSEMESLVQENWLSGCFGSGIRGEPGKNFAYNSLNTYILGEIIRKKTGTEISAFFEENLFSRLGITNYYWEKNPSGVEKCGWGLYMRPEDMAKLGILVMNNGEWEGKSIVSKDYLDKATSRQVPAPREYGNYDYGYQIWSGRDINSFLFNGMLGQNLLGFKDSGIIVVTNGGDDYNFQQCDYFEIVNRYFGGMFFDELPEDNESLERLKNYILSLSAYNLEKPVPSREQLSNFIGKKFTPKDERSASTGLMPNMLQVVENNYTTGLKSIIVTNRYDMLEIIYEENGNYNRMAVGIEKPNVCVLTFKNQKYLAAVQGTVTRDEDENPVLKIRVDFLETPCRREIKLILKNGRAILKQSEAPGMKYVMNGLDTITKAQAGKPLVSVILGSTDFDYTEYRVERIFCPQLEMTEEKL